MNDMRTAAARLLRAGEDEIGLVANTTAGINIVAGGLDWRGGDNVVTLADEFPSNQYPWMSLADLGVETRRLPTDRGRLDLNLLEDSCDDRTRVVSISWVGYAAGYRHDLNAVAEIAHRKGALLFVDAIQALGVFPLDVSRTPIDFLAADGHKWMLGPEGAGLLFVRREHLERLRPVGLGWNSVVQDHDFTRIELKLKPSPERFEGGSLNMAGFHALGASLDLLLGIGIAEIGERILHLTDLACRKLEAVGARIVSHQTDPHRSGIVAFELPGVDHAAARRHALRRNVALAYRAGCLRISPHAYNNEEDLDRLVEVMQGVMNG